MTEEQTAVTLECSYWAPGPGLCGWRGPSTEAGWCQYFEEWICPRCGASEGLRIVGREEIPRLPSVARNDA